jgi:hypothetical protein
MKRVLLCIPVLVFMLSANAQTKPAAKKKTQPTTKNATANNSNKPKSNPDTVSLVSTGTYPAKMNANQAAGFTISDPILLALDARAAGADIPINKSGIVGMPKRAFGIANGRIFLGTTGSVTSGTQTGSGSVGTGTGLGTFGSISPVMGVNGKSPYAGLSMWGNATNITVTKGDSTVRVNIIKQ